MLMAELYTEIFFSYPFLAYSICTLWHSTINVKLLVVLSMFPWMTLFLDSNEVNESITLAII